jgi:3-oxoacid CoA-transferase subunit A
VKPIYHKASEALAGLLHDGMSVMSGGFGICGIPKALIDALEESKVTGLTCISNNAGIDGVGLGKLLRTLQIAKMVASCVGENQEFERQYMAGELALEFVPQGTLAERCRAGGAGIPAFFTRTGVGTQAADGNELRDFAGETYVMEHALTADLALVKAWRADPAGNLPFRMTARNFNQVMAAAGRTCVVEVEEVVEAGAIGADAVHLPGIFIDRILLNPHPQKRIEFRTIRVAEPA